jgi:hypothetical protein
MHVPWRYSCANAADGNAVQRRPLAFSHPARAMLISVTVGERASVVGIPGGGRARRK